MNTTPANNAHAGDLGNGPFTTTYVDTHRSETEKFHHRGHGRWARGDPPANRDRRPGTRECGFDDVPPKERRQLQGVAPAQNAPQGGGGDGNQSLTDVDANVVGDEPQTSAFLRTAAAAPADSPFAPRLQPLNDGLAIQQGRMSVNEDPIYVENLAPYNCLQQSASLHALGPAATWGRIDPVLQPHRGTFALGQADVDAYQAPPNTNSTAGYRNTNTAPNLRTIAPEPGWAQAELLPPTIQKLLIDQGYHLWGAMFDHLDSLMMDEKVWLLESAFPSEWLEGQLEDLLWDANGCVFPVWDCLCVHQLPVFTLLEIYDHPDSPMALWM